MEEVPRWSQLELRSWTFYRHHIALVTRATYYQDLRPVRALLAAISIALGLFFVSPALVDLLNGPEPVKPLYSNPGFRYLSQWVVHEWALGSLFLLQGVGLTWRIYAPSWSRAWSMIFAAIGVVLYVGYPAAVTLDLQRITGQSIAMYILGAAHVVCGWRIGNGEDRSGP